VLEKFHFIGKQQLSHPGLFEFAVLETNDLADLKNLIRQHIKEFLTDFNSLKSFDIMPVIPYLETANEKLSEALISIRALPDTFILASGRVCQINYVDEKAPLISAKVQEFYGQKIHPGLLNDRLSITCELLAPNYRPTQVTKNLVRFWQESYFEVRKELKGRYPKHDWPENPQDFKKGPKPK
jgi:ATP-dependent helicase HrpB